MIDFARFSYLVPVLNQVKMIDFARFSYFVPVLKQVKMIDFARFSYFVPVLKQVKKMEKKATKKVFLTVYPVLKSEFLRPKTFLKNFIYAFTVLFSGWEHPNLPTVIQGF
jgi:hypothetical protein